MQIEVREDNVAILRGREGTVALVKALGRSFFLDGPDEEIVLFTDPEDLIVASSFGVGEKVEKGLICTLFQIRELGSPLIVLPKGHKASPRLKTVVSLGERTRLSCRIQPGTHPEQDVLCAAEELDGLEIVAVPGGALIEGFEGQVHLERFS